MRRLGAIIAGGKATRFGGDKAAALLDGRPLIEHVADGLRGQVEKLIACGCEWPGMECVQDRPSPGMGPLGGLNAALHYAQQEGYDVVATSGCDVLPVPDFPCELLPGNAVFVEGHYLLGLWPVGLASVLDAHLSGQNNLSMRYWIAEIGARPIDTSAAFHNLNTPSDVAQYAAQISTFGVR
jgi:molybdopterin-guanine dinucleotide biosynthesis protein A